MSLSLTSFVKKMLAAFASPNKFFYKNIFNAKCTIDINIFLYIRSKLKIFNFSKSDNNIFCEKEGVRIHRTLHITPSLPNDSTSSL